MPFVEGCYRCYPNASVSAAGSSPADCPSLFEQHRRSASWHRTRHVQTSLAIQSMTVEVS